jgi:hypothetical protein
MKSLPKILLACLLLAAFATCGPQKSASTETNTTDSADVAAADSNAGGADPTQEYEMPESPAAKSEADQKATKAIWEKAAANEKQFFGTPRIEKLVAGLKETMDEDGMPVYGKLDDKQFKSLTAKELVYYSVFHPETWEQICAEFLFDAGMVQGVSTYLPMNGDFMSERQEAAIKAKMDTLTTLIASCINTNRSVSEPMLHLISTLKLKAAIGPMIEAYKAQTVKDDLILSAFVEMMSMDEYAEWSNSELAKEMNGKSRDWIPLTPANADKIMYYAKNYAAS